MILLDAAHVAPELSTFHIIVAIASCLIISSFTAAGVWFGLKNTVNNNAEDIADLKDARKDAKEHIYEKIKTEKEALESQMKELKTEVKENRDKSENGLADLKTEMHEMKVEIIKEIHNINN